MRNMEKIGYALFGAAITGLGILAFNENRTYATYKEAAENLSKKTSVNVEQKIVDEAIRMAVKEETERVSSHAYYDIQRYIQKEIENGVRAELNAQKNQIASRVTAQIGKEAAKIHADQLEKKVVEAAKEAALEKLDDKMDDVLGEFNEHLGNVSKIYRSIAKTISGNKDESFLI